MAPEPITANMANTGGGPFGLEKGMRKEDIPGHLEEISPYSFKADTLPKTHSAFEWYNLDITPIQGLYRISAVGVTISTNPNGDQLRDAFEDMKVKLEKSYGEAELISFIAPESKWIEPRDWMQAVQDGDRMLGARWARWGDPSRQLPSPLDCIILGVKAFDAHRGYIFVTYVFDNFDAATQETESFKDLEDDAL